MTAKEKPDNVYEVAARIQDALLLYSERTGMCLVVLDRSRPSPSSRAGRITFLSADETERELHARIFRRNTDC